MSQSRVPCLARAFATLALTGPLVIGQAKVLTDD
jgi:hypothetical protein